MRVPCELESQIALRICKESQTFIIFGQIVWGSPAQDLGKISWEIHLVKKIEQKAQTSEVWGHILLTLQQAAISDLWTTQKTSGLEPKKSIFFNGPL